MIVFLLVIMSNQKYKCDIFKLFLIIIDYNNFKLNVVGELTSSTFLFPPNIFSPSIVASVWLSVILVKVKVI